MKDFISSVGELEQATKSRLELSAALVEALPDAMVVINESGTIVLINLQAELLFGYHRTEMVGQSVDLLLPEANRAVHLQHRTGFMNSPRVRQMGTSGLHLRGRRKTGAEVSVEIMLSPVVTREGMFVIAVVRRRNEEMI